MGFLALAYFITLFAGFFAPYSPTADEFRDHFFHPPTQLRFVDAGGHFHLRPFVERTYLIDSEHLTYASGSPLFLLYRKPAANLNPYLPDSIESSEPILSLFNEKNELLGSANALKETDVNSGEFQAIIAVDAALTERSQKLFGRIENGALIDLNTVTMRSEIQLVDEAGRPLKTYSRRNETAPVRFFVHSWPYKIAGLIPARLHLFGVNRPAYLFLLGSDQSGRDIFSRLLFGAQISLSIGLVGVLFTTTFGLLIGGIAGYYGGNVDHLVMRFAEVLMSIPALYLILTLRNVIPDHVQDSYDRIAQLSAQTFAWQNGHGSFLAVICLLLLLLSYYCHRNQWRRANIVLSIIILTLVVAGPVFVSAALRLLSIVLPGNTRLTSGWTYFLMIVILSIVGWAAMARVIRGMVLSLRESEYVLAARASGASDFRTLSRHILPNTFGYVIVRATLLIPAYILGEVALSFLGVGVQEPIPSWGNMLASCQNLRVLQQFSWSLAPGFALFLTVLAYNFLGDGLRDALDPRQR
jgi:peptide/nickel transport system permease protein